MKRIYFVPKPGVVIRDPRSRVRLPPEGKHVELTRFYRDRLADGSGVEGTPPVEEQSEG